MSAAQVLLTILAAVYAPWSQAQQATAGEFARIAVLKPKAGQAAAFAAGYQRHLGWHRDNRDPWRWYGWTFVLGERIGQFMDGTFGHALDDFDHAVAPAADAADNEANVAPHADFVSHGIYERLPDASIGAALPDASPYLALDTFVVEPGREAEFEAALAGARQGASQRLSWFSLRLGGQGPQYLLMRPARSLAEAGALPRAALPAGLVQSARSELLRYQPQMSYAPGAD